MAANAQFWNEQAATFDREPDHGLGDPDVRAAWAALIEHVLPEVTSRIVDCGCGTGSLSVLMAQLGHKVTGIDFSSEMIEHAQRKALAASTQVDFRVADASDPPLERASFDVVVSRHVLWALTDPAAVVGRWLGLLRPRGRLVLIEGRWSTGAGLTAKETLQLVRGHHHEACLIALTDPAYWGGPISDERYVIVSPPVDGL